MIVKQITIDNSITYGRIIDGKTRFNKSRVELVAEVSCMVEGEFEEERKALSSLVYKTLKEEVNKYKGKSESVNN